MKLLIITQIVDKNDDVLGAFHQWIKRFAEVFASVEVICLKKGAYDLPSNVRVHSLGKEEKRSRLQYLWRFYKYIFGLRNDYDCVFVHMNSEYVTLGGPFWRLMGKTTLLWFAHKGGSWLRLMALWLGDGVVSVSKESFRGSDSPKFMAVGHGVDPDLFSCPVPQRTSERKVILSVGRLSPIKEYDLLIDACKLLRDKYGRRDFVARIIGGPLTASDVAYVAGIKERIKAAGLEDAFDFVGPVPNKDILPYLCGASVSIAMQRGGGAGKNFLESMSCGVPTLVCTPVFNQYFGEWLPYLFYEWGAEDFAAKLDKCLSLAPDERARMGETLRSIVVEHHNLKKLVRRVKEEYERLRARR
ncbi:MAG: glycosyltransferase family 4 protein [Patescibacteria group bacterium]|nr:MAG: glycosyltransferase family 4 protein [Patescibacteria group bacterium]